MSYRFLKLLTLSTTLIISCSTEEEENIPTPTQYTLTVTAGEGGSVSTEGGAYDEGTDITITALSAEGYEFMKWSDESTQISKQIELTSDIDLTAIFKPLLIDGYFRVYSQAGLDYFGNPTWEETLDTENYRKIEDSIPSNRYTLRSVDEANPIASENVLNLTSNGGEEIISRVVYDESINEIVYFWDQEVIDEESPSGIKTVYFRREILKYFGQTLPYPTRLEEMENPKGFADDPIYSQINLDDPQSYLLAFIKDAERFGIDLSYIDPLTEFNFTFDEDLNVGAEAAPCDGETVRVIYNTNAWNNSLLFDYFNNRITTMWHEFGHAILNLKHSCYVGDIMYSTKQISHCDELIDFEERNYNNFISVNNPNSFYNAAERMFKGIEQTSYGCNNKNKIFL